MDKLILTRDDVLALIAWRDEHKADVLVGREITKQFALNSMVGAVKALM